jgi:Ca2+-binding RTX toxin-like protein
MPTLTDMKLPLPARALLPALALSIALLLTGPVAARADGGFGYDDPRSMAINAGSFDVTPAGDVVFVGSDGVFELQASGEPRLIAGGGRRPVGTSPVPATDTNLNSVVRVAAAPDGSLLLSSFPSSRVFRVTPDGMIRVVAGNGQNGTVQEGPATETSLGAPAGLAATANEGFLIGDLFASRVLEVDDSGQLSFFAGAGGSGFSGDGGPATSAQVSGPYAVEPTADGSVLIGDLGNYRIRKVSSGGTITTVAGNGERGYNGDGIPATSARISGPDGPVGPIEGAVDIEATPDGGFLFVDSGNHRVRRVGPAGFITTVAGTGTGGYNGDGIPATEARMSPREIALTGDGGFLILDRGRIRSVSPDGQISTIAGMPRDRFCHEEPYNGIQGSGRSEVLTGGPLRDLIRGEGRDDLLLGGGDTDCLLAGSGSDHLSGNGNADFLSGEGQNDLLEGDDGADHITGGKGEDTLIGEDGRDRLNGGPDEDQFSGGTGGDEIDSRDGDPDRVRCGSGRDTVMADKIDRVAPNCEKARF